VYIHGGGGIDNTPVFDAQGKVLYFRWEDFKARSTNYQNTKFDNKLNEYIILLPSENFIKTQKVEEYIENLEFY